MVQGDIQVAALETSWSCEEETLLIEWYIMVGAMMSYVVVQSLFIEEDRIAAAQSQ